MEPEPSTIGHSDDSSPGSVEKSSRQHGQQRAAKPVARVDDKPAEHTSDGEHPLSCGLVMQPYGTVPKTACGLACCVHILGMLLVVSLQMALGSDFINQSTDVALHIWDNEWFQAKRVDDEGQKICMHDQSLEEGQRQQEVTRLPAGEKEYKLQVVYLSDSGNMLELPKLREMKSLEDFIVSAEDYENFCLREPGTERCAAPLTAMMACDVTLGESQSCWPAAAWPPGPAQCQGSDAAACFEDRSQWSLADDFMDVKLHQFSKVELGQGQTAQRILAPFEAAFGSGNTASGALLSEFSMGFPLPGYSDSGDNAEAQVEAVEAFLEDAFFERLNNFNAEEAEAAGFKIGFAGGGLTDLSVQKLLMGDFSFVALAFLVVWLYVAFMMESIFIATMALLQVFLCFICGLLLYRAVFGSFFGTFHIMAIFLLVGIGVDGVFVMCDNFDAAAAHDARMKTDMWARLSWMWKFSSSAITVTSLTTAVSFVMNATSTFYGIAAFGWFAASLIVANYISMLFFFPAVIAFNKAVFGETKFLFGLKEYLSALCRNTSKETQEESELAAKAEKSGLVRFFEHHFSSFILLNRVKILAAFFVVSIFMVCQLPRMQPERGTPQLLPDDHPLTLYETIMKERFIRGGSIFNTNVEVMFGFARTPITDDDVDQSGQGFGDKDAIGSQGDVQWAPSWYVDGSSQTISNFTTIGAGFDCFIQLCNSAEIRDPNRHTGGPPSYNASWCFARDAWTYLQLNPQADMTWEDAKANVTVFNMLLERMWDDNTGEYMNRQDMAEYIFAETVNGEALYRYFKFEVRLTSSTDMDASEGNKLADNWKAWLESEMSMGSCANTSETFWPMLNVPDFHQFAVQENLISEMFKGIIISVLIALVVLIVATGNIFVGLYAAGSIGMIVVWVMAMIPIQGWELGIVENIALVMVPGLSVDYVAHLAESYIHAKFDDREHRVIAMLGHSGVSVISGSISTLLAGGCLLLCQIVFFPKFGTILIFTIAFSMLWALLFFPSLLALFGPVGIQGDWHRIIHPWLQPVKDAREAALRGGKIACSQNAQDIARAKEEEGPRSRACACSIQ